MLRLRDRLTGKELALAWAALALLGVLVYLPHVIHGGFYLDDWSNGALVLHNKRGNDIGQVLSSYWKVTLFRPVLVGYVPLTYWVFGMHMWMHLAFAALLGIVVSALLYAVLRTLRLPWIHALAIAALVLVYPWFDSTRLWPTADQIALSTAFALGGLWLALTGLSRDSWRWHAGAAALYLASIFTYEISLPSIAAFGLLYVWRFGWERARWRWAIDIAVVIVGGAWVLSQTSRTSAGIAGDWSHLRMIVDGAGTIIGRTAWPIGAHHTATPLILIGLVLLLGLGSLWLWRRRDGAGDSGAGEEGALGIGMPGWLLLAAAGFALCVLGWVIFVPADPYYTPSVYGVTNRVNGIGGIGAVILVYAAFGVLGSLCVRLFSQRAVGIALAVTVVLGGLLGIGYVTVVKRHIGIWNSAYQAEVTALDKIKARYPTLPTHTKLFVTNYPSNQTWGVPILSTKWDLNGMIKAEYGESRLEAFPLALGTGFVCLPEGMELRVLDESGAPTGEVWGVAYQYKFARIYDIEGDKSFRPADQAACEAAIAQVEPGPIVLSHTY